MHLPESMLAAFLAREVQARVKRKGWESEVSSLLIRKRGCLFIDIGAAFGYYSFLLHDNFEEVLAVEPHRKNVEIIERIKERNHYEKIKVLQCAISDKNGTAKLYLSYRPLDGLGGHSLTRSGAYVSSPPKYIEVKTVTLDSLLARTIDADLVKVDVEGAEWMVLNGAKEVMNRIRSWLIELHDPTRKKELEKLMTSFSYRVKWVDDIHIYAWKQRM
jgi:FkbM family methyltransferase